MSLIYYWHECACNCWARTLFPSYHFSQSKAIVLQCLMVVNVECHLVFSYLKPPFDVGITFWCDISNPVPLPQLILSVTNNLTPRILNSIVLGQKPIVDCLLLACQKTSYVIVGRVHMSKSFLVEDIRRYPVITPNKHLIQHLSNITYHFTTLIVL